MKSLYDLMLKSSVTNDKGVNYPDPLTIGFKRLYTKEKVKDAPMNSVTAERLDAYMYSLYGVANYDDIFLYYNGKYKNDVDEEDNLKALALNDIKTFYNENKKDNN